MSSLVSSRHQVPFFVYRRTAPAKFQLVYADVEHTNNHVFVNSTLKVCNTINWEQNSVWSIRCSPTLRSNESEYLPVCVERMTQLVLVNSADSNMKFRVCVPKRSSGLPPRGSKEIRLLDDHKKFCTDTMKLDAVRAAAAPPGAPQPPQPRPRPPVAAASQPQPQPQPRPQTITIIKPLPIFAATMIAKMTLEKNEECPIEMEALSSFEHVLVATCGHVCGPSAASLNKCPMCREACKWTTVPTH